MKKHLLLFSFLVCFSVTVLKAGTDTTGCNWLGRITYAYSWDTCKGNGFRNSLSAQVVFKNPGCLKYTWKVNGTVVGAGSYINYVVTKNGTYQLCLRVYDSCTRCDTIVCYNKTISCFTACNWKGKGPSFDVWDTCKGQGFRNSVNGHISFQNGGNTGCYKYYWYVSNKFAGNSTGISYSITSSGNYTIKLRIVDTCNNCDTTFQSSMMFSCFPVYWGYTIYKWDTCTKTEKKLRLDADFNVSSCITYLWKLNGVTKSTSSRFQYTFTQNGTYTICVKFTDTCKKSDSTVCMNYTVNCISPGCKWSQNGVSVLGWDTCQGKGGRNSIHAYVNANSRNCLTYAWKVNGVPKPGNGYYFSYPVTQDGTYDICVIVKDTCLNCDTVICVRRVFTCFGSRCKFKTRGASLGVWDSCTMTGAFIFGSIFFNNDSCLKFQWKVGSTIVSNQSSFLYSPPKNGQYLVYVKVTDTCANCDTVYGMTKTINCRSLGMNNETITDAALRVYPNPADDYIHIVWKGAATRYEWVDLLGTVVMNGQLGEGDNKLRTELNPGLYMLKVYTSEGILVRKIVIQR